MIKWHKNNTRQDLNIKDIIKVIYIKDGDNLIYSVCDALDGYLIMYYKCAADGTILEVGVEHYDEEE